MSQIEVSKIESALQLVEDRTGMLLPSLTNTVDDLISEFKIHESALLKAIRNGGLGKYGVTRHLNTQVVCVWVRKFIEERGEPYLPSVTLAQEGNEAMRKELNARGFSDEEIDSIPITVYK